ncbi:MAG: SOUL family heme-binding protein, partial [Micrococcales bacterium]
LRHYPACQVASVTVRGTIESAGNRGFYPLVNYISGNNQAAQKIAMTAPVIQEPVGDEVYEVTFVLPSGYDLNDLPVPRDSAVEVKTMPEHFALAHEFSGMWSQKRFETAESHLRNAFPAIAEKKGLSASVSNKVCIARFDPPWKPGFLRRNEVLMRVSVQPKKGEK